jgi:hypothetical protein
LNSIMIPKFIFISWLFLQSAYVNYTNPEKDYSFEINNRAHYLRKSVNDGYIDVFNIVNATDSKTGDYILNVSKLTNNIPFTTEMLMLDEFKDNFSGHCNCEVVESKKMIYKNMEGILFRIRIKKSTGYLAGYSFSTAKGKNVYNITCLTTEELMPKFENEYTHLLNSMEVFK